MSGTPKWSEADIDRMVAIVREHTDMIEASAAVAAALGQQMNRSMLAQLLTNRRGIRYGQILKRKPPPPPPPKESAPTLDPVERREKVDEVSRLRSEHADLVAQVREFRARQAFIDRLSDWQGVPSVERKERKSGIREMAAVWMASDWHVEETVDPESIGYVNAFNLAIADDAITRFFDAIIWHHRHNAASGSVSIRTIVLALIGDLITGYLHEELVETNGLSPVNATLWLLPRLRDGIRRVLKELPEIERMIVPCAHGNHGRTTEKRRISTGPANSFEWIVYHQLADAFADDKRVRFILAASAHQFVDVFGFRLHVTHGDEFRFFGGVGGLTIPLNKRIAAWNQGPQRAHVHMIGHYHQALDIGPGVVNGSLIGYNAYAQSIGASPEPPQQVGFFVDSKHGKCDSGKRLWVDSGKRVAKRAA